MKVAMSGIALLLASALICGCAPVRYVKADPSIPELRRFGNGLVIDLVNPSDQRDLPLPVKKGSDRGTFYARPEPDTHNVVFGRVPNWKDAPLDETPMDLVQKNVMKVLEAAGFSVLQDDAARYPRELFVRIILYDFHVQGRRVNLWVNAGKADLGYKLEFYAEGKALTSKDFYSSRMGERAFSRLGTNCSRDLTAAMEDTLSRLANYLESDEFKNDILNRPVTTWPLLRNPISTPLPSPEAVPHSFGPPLDK